MELGQVYAGFGARVTVVEMTSGLLPGADSDLVRPLKKRLDAQLEQVSLDTKVVGMKEVKGGIEVAFEGKNLPKSKKFDKVLVAVGRCFHPRTLLSQPRHQKNADGRLPKAFHRSNPPIDPRAVISPAAVGTVPAAASSRTRVVK